MADPTHEAASPWNLPNALTTARILLVPVFGSLLLSDEGTNVTQRFAALGVFLVAMLTDRIDGDIARSRGLVTDLGKILDPIADKALLGMAFVGLSIIGLVPWWITVLVLAREVGVTAVRFVVIRHGVMPAGRGGKVKTFAQAVALSLLVLPTWVLPGASAWRWAAYAVLTAAVVITVVTGIDYLHKAHRLRRSSPRALAKRAARETRPR
ncbi:MAG: CDP-diacylglycerol--glycerol-3-phosphate 3-phosphatidyltransferase [Actinomycetales bacterium]|nr:CDP-diacylglycerol--glycerol-3-phosphate 3-phosphatidyltransferase [Actinomycetales bacterium]